MSERWYEIVGYFDPDKEEVVEQAGHRTVVRGSIDDVIIVQVPAHLHPQDAHRLMAQVQETMSKGGINRPLILMPDNVRLMKVKRLSAKETREIKDIAAESRKTKRGTVH